MESVEFERIFRKLDEAGGAKTISAAKAHFIREFHLFFDHLETVSLEDVKGSGRYMLRKLESAGFAHWNGFAQLYTITKTV